MARKSGRGSLLKIVTALIVIAAIGFAVFRFVNIKQGGQQADEVLDRMKQLIPGLGVDTGVSTGSGKEQLSVITIQGIDIVGCVEIPALDIMVPVTAEGNEQAGFVTYVSGSPVSGELRLKGSREDIFNSLASAKPGDNVAFTDVEGVRYNYRVTTQYHLKSWDESDDDLMLCYPTDSKTDFVVGCKVAQ